MIRATGGLRAMQFETLRAASSGDYYSMAIFAVEGQPGLYRRIGADQADRFEGAIEAYWTSGLITLVPWTEANQEIREAGFVRQITIRDVMERLSQTLGAATARLQDAEAQPSTAEDGAATVPALERISGSQSLAEPQVAHTPPEGQIEPPGASQGPKNGILDQDEVVDGPKELPESMIPPPVQAPHLDAQEGQEPPKPRRKKARPAGTDQEPFREIEDSQLPGEGFRAAGKRNV